MEWAGVIRRDGAARAEPTTGCACRLLPGRDCRTTTALCSRCSLAIARPTREDQSFHSCCRLPKAILCETRGPPDRPTRSHDPDVSWRSRGLQPWPRQTAEPCSSGSHAHPCPDMHMRPSGAVPYGECDMTDVWVAMEKRSGTGELPRAMTSKKAERSTIWGTEGSASRTPRRTSRRHRVSGHHAGGSSRRSRGRPPTLPGSPTTAATGPAVRGARSRSPSLTVPGSARCRGCPGS